jgi:hypothetical protein
MYVCSKIGLFDIYNLRDLIFSQDESKVHGNPGSLVDPRTKHLASHVVYYGNVLENELFNTY